MSIVRATEYLKKYGEDKNIRIFDASSATTEEAASCVNDSPAHIAKTLSFKVNDRVILVVASGDTRVDNAKFKAEFGKRGSMLPHDDVERLIGHAVGGVCPFGINPGVEVYLDKSISRFDYGYLAAGSSNSLIRLTIPRLEEITKFPKWVDVCKIAF